MRTACLGYENHTKSAEGLRTALTWTESRSMHGRFTGQQPPFAGPDVPASGGMGSGRGEDLPWRPVNGRTAARSDSVLLNTDFSPAAPYAKGHGNVDALERENGLARLEEPLLRRAGPSVPGETANGAAGPGAFDGTPPWRSRLPQPDPVRAYAQQDARTGGRASFRGEFAHLCGTVARASQLQDAHDMQFVEM